MRSALLTMLGTLLVVAATAGASTPPPIPRIEQQRIVAHFPTTYLPGNVPPGYRYVNWTSEPGSATAFGNFLDVTFARHGSYLEWIVGDSRDPAFSGYNACSANPYTPTIYRLGARRIVFQTGKHGDTATLCLPGTRTSVYAWNNFALSPRSLALFVASARPVG
jgi:hypothetical protein